MAGSINHTNGNPQRRSLNLFVQIPALNEEENIGRVIRGIPRKLDGIDSVRVVVVNDGSTDRTVQVATEAGADIVVSHHSNKGIARAYQTGIDTCLAYGADIIVNTDADGQYEGADIAKLVQPIIEQHADMVIGDRQTHKLAHFTPAKRVFQWLGSRVVEGAAGVRVPDAVSGFRALSRDAALHIYPTAIYSYTIQTLIQAGKLGLAVRFVPIRSYETTRPSRLQRGMLQFIVQQATILMRTYTTYEPLKTFMVLSAPFLIIGTILILRLILIAAVQGGQFIGRLQSSVAGLVSIVIGMLLFITGVIADRVRENRQLLEDLMYRVREQSAHRYSIASLDIATDLKPTTDHIDNNE
jgi:glycosyltransferase involved in cell wall biosynthesis